MRLDKFIFTEEIVVSGELQEKVEKSFVEWCMEVGVPVEKLKGQRRFHSILEWVAEKIELREQLVKTGWKSWERKWRDRAYELHLTSVK